MRDNRSSGRFINLLHDTKSAYIPAEGSVVVPASTNSLTDATHPYARTGSVSSSSAEKQLLKPLETHNL